MRLIPRALAGLALAASGLIAVPTSGALHAAPATSKVSSDAPGRAGFMIAGAAGESRLAVFMPLDVVASVEGVGTDVLQQDLQAGQTLLRIAGARYSSAGDLATALLANLKRKLDMATSAGKFTPAEESQQYGALLSATETLVVTVHPQVITEPGKAGPGKAGPSGMQVDVNPKLIMIQAVASSCNTTADALIAALRPGGKSILQVCQATNPSATVDSLVAAVITAVKAQLDAAVSSGKLSAGQEGQMLSDLQAQLPAMLTTPVSAEGTAGTK